MSTVYINAKQLRNNALDKLKSSANLVSASKDSLSYAFIPYDFKYYNYLNNLKNDLSNYASGILNLCNYIDFSINDFTFLVNSELKYISQKRVVEVPIRKKAITMITK